MHVGVAGCMNIQVVSRGRGVPSTGHSSGQCPEPAIALADRKCAVSGKKEHIAFCSPGNGRIGALVKNLETSAEDSLHPHDGLSAVIWGSRFVLHYLFYVSIIFALSVFLYIIRRF